MAVAVVSAADYFVKFARSFDLEATR